MLWLLGIYLLSVLCLAQNNEFVEHDITLCEHDEKVTLSCPDQTAISILEVAVGNFSCRNVTNDECLSFIYGKLFLNCHEQNMCVLTPETVFHESCQKAARYLKINYSCVCMFYDQFFNTLSMCTTSLSDVTCSEHPCREKGYQMEIYTVSSVDMFYSKCSSCNKKEIKQSVVAQCHKNGSCSNPTHAYSCLFHPRYASIKYLCKAQLVNHSGDSSLLPKFDMSDNNSEVGISVGVPVGVLAVIVGMVTLIVAIVRKRKVPFISVLTTKTVEKTKTTNESEDCGNAPQYYQNHVFPLYESIDNEQGENHDYQDLSQSIRQIPVNQNNNDDGDKDQFKKSTC